MFEENAKKQRPIPYVNLDRYNPRVSYLVDKAKERRSNPKDSREALVKYGIKELDVSLFGIDTEAGELNVIMGFHKQRKTTFIINIVVNIMMAKTPEVKPAIMIDTLESGMIPERYTEALICNVATRYLHAKGHRFDTYCPICNSSKCYEVGITPESLHNVELRPAQLEAVEFAELEVSSWRLYIFGANPEEGDTRQYEHSVERAEFMVKHDVKIIIVDHVQQYQTDTSLYEKQELAVSGFSNIVAKYKCVVFILSQISLGSWREAKSGTGVTTAKGGNKAAEEAMTVFEVQYVGGDNNMLLKIKESRKASPLTVVQNIEKMSGAFLKDNVEDYNICLPK